MKLIDKEKLEAIRAEIERLKKDWQCYLRYSVESKYRTEAYTELIDFIDSIPEEFISDDLEEAAKNHADKNYVEWLDIVSGDERDDHYPVSEAFKAGANWHKEQMMKNVIEATARPDDGEIWCNLESFQLEDGDKVKVIIIKDE